MKKEWQLAFRFVFLLVAQAFASVAWARASAGAASADEAPTWVELGETSSAALRACTQFEIKQGSTKPNAKTGVYGPRDTREIYPHTVFSGASQ